MSGYKHAGFCNRHGFLPKYGFKPEFGFDFTAADPVPPDDPGPSYPEMTNAQKLSLTLVPAAQQTGAIKVSGGTQDGIYTLRGVYSGKPFYNLVDAPTNAPDDQGLFSFFWSGDSWVIQDATGTSLYYSPSDVATPDLATNWKNASDDTPASITVALATSTDLIDYGQSVKVSDGFYVSGSAFASLSGLYLLASGTCYGRPFYYKAGKTYANPETVSPLNTLSWQDGQWAIYGETLSENDASNDDVAYPWLATSWANGATLTHPAVQTLQPPSDSFVVSGAGSPEANGLYTYRGILHDGLDNPFIVWNRADKPSSPTSFCVRIYANIPDTWTLILGDYNDGGAYYAPNSGVAAPAPWLEFSWSPQDVGVDPAPTFTPNENADPTVVVVSGAGTAEANGIWIKTGIGNDGEGFYERLGNVGDGTTAILREGAGEDDPPYDAGAWVISVADAFYKSAEFVAHPWLVTAWDDISSTGGAPTVTAQIMHPAVFVSGAGTSEANGIYVAIGIYNGRQRFLLLGATDNGAESSSEIFWSSGDAAWYIVLDGGTNAYANAADVPFPWTGALNVQGGGDSPAPTLSLITQGELVAGVTVAGAGNESINRAFSNHGPDSANARPFYEYVDASDDIISPASSVWIVPGYLSSTRPTFPWLATYSIDDGAPPAPTVSRNDVAAEANWTGA
jgi:hypothetical protein